MTRESLRDNLIRLAHSFNASLGQFLFTTSAFLLLGASVAGARLFYLVVLGLTAYLVWTFRADLRS